MNDRKNERLIELHDFCHSGHPKMCYHLLLIKHLSISDYSDCLHPLSNIRKTWRKWLILIIHDLPFYWIILFISKIKPQDEWDVVGGPWHLLHWILCFVGVSKVRTCYLACNQNIFVIVFHLYLSILSHQCNEVFKESVVDGFNEAIKIKAVLLQHIDVVCSEPHPFYYP